MNRKKRAREKGKFLKEPRWVIKIKIEKESLCMQMVPKIVPEQLSTEKFQTFFIRRFYFAHKYVSKILLVQQIVRCMVTGWLLSDNQWQLSSY